MLKFDQLLEVMQSIGWFGSVFLASYALIYFKEHRANKKIKSILRWIYPSFNKNLIGEANILFSFFLFYSCIIINTIHPMKTIVKHFIIVIFVLSQTAFLILLIIKLLKSKLKMPTKILSSLVTLVWVLFMVSLNVIFIVHPLTLSSSNVWEKFRFRLLLLITILIFSYMFSIFIKQFLKKDDLVIES